MLGIPVRSAGPRQDGRSRYFLLKSTADKLGHFLYFKLIMLKHILQDFRDLSEVFRTLRIKKYYLKIVGNFFLKKSANEHKKSLLNMFCLTYNITTLLHDTSKQAV